MTLSQRRRTSITAVVIFFVLWELIGRFGVINPLLIGQPTAMVGEALDLFADSTTYGHMGSSLRVLGVGLAAALLVGIPLGLLIGRFRTLDMLLQPGLIAAYVTPRLALLPLIVVWVGIGLTAKTAIVFLGAIFPIVIATAAGLKEIEPMWLTAARSFGASETRLFRQVMLPGSMPYLMNGIRLGFGRALLGVIVAEMFAGREGLGHLIVLYGASFRTSRLMVVALLIGAFGTLCVALLTRLERGIVVWKEELREA